MNKSAYIGIKACGCAIAAIVDSPDMQEEIALQLPKWIKRGLKIERVTVEEGRKRLQRCQHEKGMK